METNEIFLFPFEKVQTNSNIIIYGMGDVGKNFYNQVSALGYCNIVAIADRAAERYASTRYPVIHPSRIADQLYDYIVIAVASVGVADQIKRELIIKYNISENKIIFMSNRKTQICLSDTSLSQWLDSLEIMNKEILRFLVLRIGNINYFAEIVDAIWKLKEKHANEKIEEIKNCFWDYLHSDVDVKNKIVVLRILYAAGCFDAELMEFYLKNVLFLYNCDVQLWQLHDITLIEINTQDCRYKSYYADKRELMKKIAFTCYRPALLSKSRTKSNRVAIVAVVLGDKRFTHNRLIVPYANEMVRQGREVAIFPVDLFRYRYGESFIQPIMCTEQKSVKYKSEHQELFDPRVRIIYNEGDSFKDRISNVMDNLIDYNPYVVYDFCGENAFMSPLIQRHFYTVALPMRGYASSACFDTYICRNKYMCMEENKYFHSIKEKQMEEVVLISAPEKAEWDYCRKDYGIKEDAFVITTVGMRLDNELTPEFVDCVCGFLKEYKRACWILVGNKISRYVRNCYEELFLNGQIIEWGYEKNLLGFYAICDVYWNPRRLGGGGSLVMAMRCGLPIITTDFFSDILSILGKENAVDNYEDCRKYVEKLYGNEDFYYEKSQLMKDRINLFSVEECVRKLLEVGNNCDVK